MSQYTAVPDKNAGDPFTQSMWATYIEQNLNKGVMRPLGDLILGTAAASFDFASIDQSFAHLRLVLYGRGDTAAVSANTLMRLNNDAAANYNYELLVATNTTPGGFPSIGQTWLSPGSLPAATAPATVFGCAIIDIPYYANAANFKTFLGLNYFETADSAAGQNIVQSGGIWKSAAAISRVTLLPSAGNFAAGSRATLYGCPF